MMHTPEHYSKLCNCCNKKEVCKHREEYIKLREHFDAWANYCYTFNRRNLDTYEYIEKIPMPICKYFSVERRYSYDEHDC